MNKYIPDYGYVMLNKVNEELCGDKIEKIIKEDSLTLVLADGLGSGVKANILATLTSKILATLISNDFTIEDASDMLLNTLPVCKVRNIAYSTFSIIKITHNIAKIIEFDNPKIIYIKKGKIVELEQNKKIINQKVVYESNISIDYDDMFIMISDGVVHAGIGKTLNLGFTRNELCTYLEDTYNAEETAKQVSLKVCGYCNELYQGQPGDDTSCAVLKIVQEKFINIMIGPPSDKTLDRKVIEKFLSKKGKKIVCGGTTSHLISKFLKEDVVVEKEYYDLSVPPIAHIEGIDLVTEGILTLKRAVEILKEFVSPKLCEDFTLKQDGASLLLSNIIKEGTTINIFVGRAINEAHQNMSLHIDFNTKLKTIEGFYQNLIELGKTVNIEYY